MKSWMYILILLLAFMLVLPPAAAYVSFKQTPWEGDGEEPYPPLPQTVDGYGAQVTFMQASLVGWEIYWYNKWGDEMGSAADWELPVTDYAPLYMSDHCDWTVAAGMPGYFPEYQEFPLDRGYQTWVTIVPVIDKFGVFEY